MITAIALIILVALIALEYKVVTESRRLEEEEYEDDESSGSGSDLSPDGPR